MARTTVVLPIPASSGVGASVSVATLDTLKSFVFNQSLALGEILVVEGSGDPGAPTDAQRTWNPIYSVNSTSPGEVTFNHVASAYRVRRINASVLSNPSIDVGAENVEVKTFFTLPVPVLGLTLSGFGAAVNISAAGQSVSVFIGGAFGINEILNIQGSNDGTHWDTIFGFNSGTPGRQFDVLAYSFLRTFRQFTGPNTLTALAACASATSSTNPGQGVLQRDSVNAIGTRLVLLDETTLIQGTICYVGNNDGALSSVGDNYQLKFGENLTPDSLEVVNALNFATTGGQWVRMHTPNDQSLAALFWSVDPIAGNDEATGRGVTQAAADLVPLKTIRELNKRLVGANYVGNTVVYHVINSIPLTDDGNLTNVQTGDGLAYPIVLGKKVALFTGQITAYQTAVPGANTGYQMTIAGIPVSWTASGLLGLMVQKNDGTKTAFVQSDLGGKTARIDQPRSTDPVSANTGASTNFVVGENVTVYSLPSVPFYPFTGKVLFGGVGDVVIRGPSSDLANFNQSSVGTGSPLIINCILDGVFIQGGNSMILAKCSLANHVNNFTGGQSTFFEGCSLRNAQTLMSAGFALWSDNLDIQAGGIVFSDGNTFISNDPGCTLSLFANVIHALFVNGQSRLQQHYGTIYGSGNTNFLLEVAANSLCVAQKAGFTAVTTAAHALRVANVSFDVADIPISDITTMSSITE